MYYHWIPAYYLGPFISAHAAEDASRAERKAQNVSEKMADAFDRQALVIRTLLAFCEKRGLFNEAEFRELMNEIDLSDGTLDGKYKPQQTPQVCPGCGKTNGRRAVSCMYCGTIFDARPVV
jgi:hypothetical protein